MSMEHPPWWPYSKLPRMAFRIRKAPIEGTKTSQTKDISKNGHPKVRSFPNPKIMFGRLLSAFFLKGYISIRIRSFSGIQGSYGSQKQKKHNIAPPTSPFQLPPNFSVAKVLGNFNSTPSKVKDPEKDNMPIA